MSNLGKKKSIKHKTQEELHEKVREIFRVYYYNFIVFGPITEPNYTFLKPSPVPLNLLFYYK